MLVGVFYPAYNTFKIIESAGYAQRDAEARAARDLAVNEMLTYWYAASDVAFRLGCSVLKQTG